MSNDRFKVLVFLISAVLIGCVAVGLSFFVYGLIDNIQQGRLEERYNALVAEVDTVCDRVSEVSESQFAERFKDYSELLLNYFGEVSQRKNIFAAVYDNSGALVVKEDYFDFSQGMYDPWKNDYFGVEVNTSSSGEFTDYHYFPDKHGNPILRPVRVYFKKVPIHDNFVVCVGLDFSSDSVLLRPELYVLIFGVYGVLVIGFAIFIFLLGHYISKRI